MFGVLLPCGIPSQIVEDIKTLYLTTMAQVVTEDGNTSFFQIIGGVQQGDTLVPYLFIIILDYVMRIKIAKDNNFEITLHWWRWRHCLALWICMTSRDIASCKLKTWPVLHKLDNIWRSSFQKWLKMWFFTAVAESILLYGADSWTPMKAHESQLDGMYTEMLHFASNVHCSQHVTNKQLYSWVTAVNPRKNQYSKFSSGCHSMEEESMVGPP